MTNKKIWSVIIIVFCIVLYAFYGTYSKLKNTKEENMTLRAALSQPAKTEKVVQYVTVPQIRTVEKIIVTTATVAIEKIVVTTETIVIDRVIVTTVTVMNEKVEERDPAAMPQTVSEISQSPELPVIKQKTVESRFTPLAGYEFSTNDIIIGLNYQPFQHISLGGFVSKNHLYGVSALYKY